MSPKVQAVKKEEKNFKKNNSTDTLSTNAPSGKYLQQSFAHKSQTNKKIQGYQESFEHYGE